MPRIMFTVDKAIKDCCPELVTKLLKATCTKDVYELENEFGCNEVTDAMFAIAAEKGTGCYTLSEDRVIDWLWDEFDEHCYEYIRDAFVEENNSGWKTA